MLSIVLTSCLSPSIELRLPHHDSFLRFNDVQANLVSLLSTANHIPSISTIYLIDSSPTACIYFHYFQKLSDQYPTFHFIHFPITDPSILSKGKGFSELHMINHVLETEETDKYFVKLTSRYDICNLLQAINSFISRPQSFSCLHNIFRGVTQTFFFISNTNFWLSLQYTSHFAKINDNYQYFFEHALYDSLLEHRTTSLSPIPILSSKLTSGQTGMPHKRTYDFFSIRSLLANHLLNRHERFPRKLAKIFRLFFV